MSTSENQRQHKVPQVYLKHFGYEEEGKWYVSLNKSGEYFSKQELIETFTVETNIFDLPFKDMIERRSTL